MKNNLYLLTALIVLYFGSVLALKAVYGPSCSTWEGENCWIPDGKSGWVMHGNPTGPKPDIPSEIIPIGIQYIPIFLPSALLILFMFTPLSKKLERKREPDESSGPAEDSSASDAKDSSGG